MPRKKKAITGEGGPQGPPPEATAPPPVPEKEIKVTVETIEEAAGAGGPPPKIPAAVRECFRQPGLFEGLDEIVTALKLEEDHVSEQCGKLRKKLNALEEKLIESDKHYDNLLAVRKQAEKLLGDQKKK